MATGAYGAGMHPTNATTAAWLRRWAMHAAWRGGQNAIPGLLFTAQYLPWRAAVEGGPSGAHGDSGLVFFYGNWSPRARGTVRNSPCCGTKDKSEGVGRLLRPGSCWRCVALKGTFVGGPDAMPLGGPMSSSGR